MRSFLLALTLSFLLVRSDDAAPMPDPANLVRIRVLEDSKASLIPWGTNKMAPCIFEFAGQHVKTTDEFKAAVLTLPQGTELHWGGDCIHFTELPLSGLVVAITDIQAFCAAHGVYFHYMPGGY